MSTTISEARHLAKAKFGNMATVRPIHLRIDYGESSKWFVVSVDGQTIGLRRLLDDLPNLIARGKFKIEGSDNLDAKH